MDRINFRRLRREARTLEVMVTMYCKAHHSSKTPCQDCQGLLSYALDRLDKCPYGWEKPVCNQCHIHCYKKAMREQIRMVMRYVGPRMLLRHPVLAIFHMLDSRRSKIGVRKGRYKRIK
jgi:hypothetical protein